MSKFPRKVEKPPDTLGNLREKVLGGSNLLIDSLTDEELEAMQSLIFSGEAEIASSAFKPFLAAKLERTIISYFEMTAVCRNLPIHPRWGMTAI
jgi:hypothetical protein